MAPVAVNAAGGAVVPPVQSALGQTEIADVRLIVRIDEDIGRLQIAVQDALFVRVLHGAADGGEIAGRVARPQRTAREQSGQRLPLNQSHTEICLSLMLAGVVDGHDVRVYQMSGGLRFAAEARQIFRGGQFAIEDHFESDRAIETALPRLIHDAHAAAADLFEQLVIAEGSWQRGWVGEPTTGV